MNRYRDRSPRDFTLNPEVSPWSGLSLHPLNGCWALMRDYRWGSPSSLYTFRKTNNALCTAPLCGSARDYPSHSMGCGLPRIHPVYYPRVTARETLVPESLASASSATRAILRLNKRFTARPPPFTIATCLCKPHFPVKHSLYTIMIAVIQYSLRSKLAVLQDIYI